MCGYRDAFSMSAESANALIADRRMVVVGVLSFFVFRCIVGDALWQRANLWWVVADSFGNCLNRRADTVKDHGDGGSVTGLELIGFAVNSRSKLMTSKLVSPLSLAAVVVLTVSEVSMMTGLGLMLSILSAGATLICWPAVVV